MKFEFDVQLDAVQRPAYDHGPIENEPETRDSIPPLTKTLVLAYQIQWEITTGRFNDYADAARQLRVSRARITQLMKLTQLAPIIQDVILCEPDQVGHLFEKSLRPIAAVADHDHQWLRFQELIAR